MTEQITPPGEDRIINELSAMRQSMDSMKSTIEDKFESALKPIERGLRSITLIPLALIFGGLSSWLFYQSKITEQTWFWLTVFLMMPFFGEGARAILDKLPLKTGANVTKILIVLFGLLCLAGCAVTFPLGEGGKYGEIYGGYRPPTVYVFPDVSNPPLFHEK